MQVLLICRLRRLLLLKLQVTAESGRLIWLGEGPYLGGGLDINSFSSSLIYGLVVAIFPCPIFIEFKVVMFVVY